jgi:hypothetical protein
MHIIPEAFAFATMATLASDGIAVDTEEKWEDWVILVLGLDAAVAIIGCQPTDSYLNKSTILICESSFS